MPLPRTIFETLSSIILGKGDSSKFKSHLVDLFRHEEDAVATISELLLVVFRDMKALGGPSASNILVFFNFFREVVGEWELISKERVERLNLRDLIHIFPSQPGTTRRTRAPSTGSRSCPRGSSLSADPHHPYKPTDCRICFSCSGVRPISRNWNSACRRSGA